MTLLRRIETFLARTATKPARFGRDAVGDSHFVFDLRDGREPRPATVARVTAWLDRAEASAR